MGPILRYWRSDQLSLNKIFDPNTPSMRKGRDGENGKKCHCQLSPENDRLQRRRSCQLFCFIPDFARPTVCMQCVVYSEAVLSRLPWVHPGGRAKSFWSTHPPTQSQSRVWRQARCLKISSNIFQIFFLYWNSKIISKCLQTIVNFTKIDTAMQKLHAI